MTAAHSTPPVQSNYHCVTHLSLRNFNITASDNTAMNKLPINRKTSSVLSTKLFSNKPQNNEHYIDSFNNTSDLGSVK